MPPRACCAPNGAASPEVRGLFVLSRAGVVVGARRGGGHHARLALDTGIEVLLDQAALVALEAAQGEGGQQVLNGVTALVGFRLGDAAIQVLSLEAAAGTMEQRLERASP